MVRPLATGKMMTLPKELAPVGDPDQSIEQDPPEILVPETQLTETQETQEIQEMSQPITRPVVKRTEEIELFFAISNK